MKPNKKQLIVYIASIILTAAVTFGITFGATRVKESKGKFDTDTLEAVSALIEEYSLYGFPGDIDFNSVLAQALLSSTGDRYAYYFTASDYNNYSSGLDGYRAGIGAVIDADSSIPDAILVCAVHKDSPADKAGIAARDEIVEINGESIEALGGYNHATEKLSGSEGEKVTLTVRRADETFKAEPVFGTYTAQTVFYGKCGSDSSVGYVRITTFDSITVPQFISAVTELEADGIRSIIFDLRGNGGGRLLSVAEMLAFLLPDGIIAGVDYASDKMTDYTISSSGDSVIYSGNHYKTDDFGGELQVSHKLNIPCAVLTDGNTASAAELFTSALRDYSTEAFGNAISSVTVGVQTYGKGSMQTTIKLSGGSYCKLTVAHYNPPCGINYDGAGIIPDIISKTTLSSKQLYLADETTDAPRMAALAALSKG